MAKYGDPYSEFVLCIYPSKVHTAVGSHLCCGAQEQLGVRYLARSLYIHSPHLQFLPTQDSNLQPFDYESNSLTIWPWFP